MKVMLVEEMVGDEETLVSEIRAGTQRGAANK